jgi:putative FmdB family regulatory protein
VPIYDYVCSNGHVTEVIHGVYAAGPTECPVCGEPLRKAMSAPTIVFKGSGWAKKERSTKPGSTKSDADSAKPAAGDGGKADGAKTDSAGSTEAAKPGASTTSEAK